MPQTLTLDHVSPATRLLEKRRQMFEVQEALNAQKEDFARREEAFRRREEGLRQKDLELQEMQVLMLLKGIIYACWMLMICGPQTN